MTKEDIKKFLKSQHIDVKIDPKTGKAEVNLYKNNKKNINNIKNSETVKPGQSISGKISINKK